MRRLRVLHVITRMVVGGAQENTLATVVGLRARGHDAVLVTGPSDGPEGSLIARAWELGVEPILVPELVRSVSPGRDAVALARLHRLIRGGSFDVVHTHTSKAGIVGRAAAWMAGTPVVVHTPHGHVFEGYFGPWVTRGFAALERTWARQTDAMIALSDRCRLDHLALGIGSPERFVTIPSGIAPHPTGDRDVARRAAGVGHGDLVVGCVGRLAPVKGQDTLVTAFATVARSEPRARLVLVGDGPSRPELERLARALGLEERVTFLGLRTDAVSLLPGFDLYVQPSLNEGMGRALAQAMTAGLPVVASDAPGPAGLIGPGSGVLVRPRDPDALAEAVTALLRDEPLRRRLGRAARERAASFWTEDRMVEEIERLYTGLLPAGSLRRRGSPPPGSREIPEGDRRQAVGR